MSSIVVVIHSIRRYLLEYFSFKPITLASSNAGIVGSNPTKGMDICIVCVCSVCW
jgi:hypothetical protein